VDLSTPGNCRNFLRLDVDHCSRSNAGLARDVSWRFFLLNGMLSLVQMFVDRSVPWIWSLLIGICGIAAGVLIIRHPLVAALTLPTVIVIVFGVEGVVMGILEFIGGFTGGGIGSFIRGVFNFVIGLLLLSAPLTAALAVPLVFGALLLVEGIALIILAFRTRPSEA